MPSLTLRCGTGAPSEADKPFSPLAEGHSSSLTTKYSFCIYTISVDSILVSYLSLNQIFHIKAITKHFHF